MRIEAIDNATAAVLLAQTSDIDRLNLRGKVSSSAVKENSAADIRAQYIKENRSLKGADLYQITENLNVGQNKTMILNLLHRGDLMTILYLLGKEELLYGINLFPKRKLLRLMMNLPKSVILRMLLKWISIEKLVMAMPSREFFRILHSPKLKTKHLVRAFRNMDPKFLHFILGKITGRNTQQMSRTEMLNIFIRMKKRTLLNGMRFLPFKALQPMMFSIFKQDKSLIMDLGSSFISKMFMHLDKFKLVESFRMLDSGTLINFIGQLPDQSLLMTAAQIDTGDLEQYLINDQPNLLATLGEINLSELDLSALAA